MEWLFPVLRVLRSCKGAEVKTQEFIMKMSTGDDLLKSSQAAGPDEDELVKKRTGGKKNHGRTSPCMALATVRGCDWHWEDATRVFGKGWIKAHRHSWLHKNTRSFRASFYQTRRNDLRLKAPEATHHWQMGVICVGRGGKQGVPEPNSCYCIQAPALSVYCKIKWKIPPNVVEDTPADVLCTSQFQTGWETVANQPDRRVVDTQQEAGLTNVAVAGDGNSSEKTGS